MGLIDRIDGWFSLTAEEQFSRIADLAFQIVDGNDRYEEFAECVKLSEMDPKNILISQEFAFRKSMMDEYLSGEMEDKEDLLHAFRHFEPEFSVLYIHSAVLNRTEAMNKAKDLLYDIRRSDIKPKDLELFYAMGYEEAIIDCLKNIQLIMPEEIATALCHIMVPEDPEPNMMN